MTASRWWVLLLLGSILLLVGAGCSSSAAAQPERPQISFDEIDPTVARRNPADDEPIRVAVAAVFSPQGTAESYRMLLDYLEEKLDRPVTLVQRRTYREINDLIEQGQVDIAFVCTSAYVAGHDDFGMRLLVAPEVDQAVVYYSLLIVPADSTAESMADLAGRTFAFTDPMSHSGRAYPTYLVHQLGFEPEAFFGRTFFTYSHDDAIRAVANGIADGANVDSLVYEHVIEREPELAERVKIIHRSPPFGIPPVVTGPNVSSAWVTTLREILLGMPDDPAGQAALQAIGVDRFVLVDDSAYEGVRQILRELGQ